MANLDSDDGFCKRKFAHKHSILRSHLLASLHHSTRALQSREIVQDGKSTIGTEELGLVVPAIAYANGRIAVWSLCKMLRRVLKRRIADPGI